MTTRNKKTIEQKIEALERKAEILYLQDHNTIDYYRRLQRAFFLREKYLSSTVTVPISKGLKLSSAAAF